jgi:hypothetical protein
MKHTRTIGYGLLGYDSKKHTNDWMAFSSVALVGTERERHGNTKKASTCFFSPQDGIALRCVLLHRCNNGPSSIIGWEQGS